VGELIWLSFPLGMDDPRPPAIPAPSLTPLYTVTADGANVQMLTLASHTGTHLDAPRHVIDDGLCITDFSPEELIFTRPVVLDLPIPDAAIVQPSDLEPLAARLAEADLALFRFGYGMVRRQEPARFSTRCPGFGVESARWLRHHAPSLRAIGMDVPSVACIAALEQTMPAHHELLGGAGRRFLIIEDMNLEQDLANLREARVCPWLVRGMDSGPCAVIGVLHD
jgi:kynurenine formamidase